VISSSGKTADTRPKSEDAPSYDVEPAIAGGCVLVWAWRVHPSCCSSKVVARFVARAPPGDDTLTSTTGALPAKLDAAPSLPLSGVNRL